MRNILSFFYKKIQTVYSFESSYEKHLILSAYLKYFYFLEGYYWFITEKCINVIVLWVLPKFEPKLMPP